MRRNTASRLRVPRSRTSMYAPVGILTASCLARISAFTASGVDLAPPCLARIYALRRASCVYGEVFHFVKSEVDFVSEVTPTA